MKLAAAAIPKVTADTVVKTLAAAKSKAVKAGTAKPLENGSNKLYNLLMNE